VQLLLDKGAQVNPRTKAGHTPLAAALSNGHSDVAALLRTRGAVE